MIKWALFIGLVCCASPADWRLVGVAREGHPTGTYYLLNESDQVVATCCEDPQPDGFRWEGLYCQVIE